MELNLYFLSNLFEFLQILEALNIIWIDSN
jgi:hypothetical protein